ncbi:MAG: AraC family transcriptional regulator [Eubacterium sp.]|nr:AraC family transcriptional regulator [Eubacterium sp.]
MIKVLIAEDEYLENEGFKTSILNMHGDVVVESVFNGFEAMNKLNSFCPDILISDINMPGMSGIELATKFRKTIPDINIIFISGYDDFDYLKSAIKLDAFEYILKPVDEGEFKEVFDKAVTKISREKVVKEEDIVFRQIVSESIPVMKEKFLRDLIYGTLEIKDIWKRIGKLGIELQEGIYSIVLFEIDDYSLLQNEQEKKLLNRGLDEALGGVNPGKYHACYKQNVCIGNGRGAVILSFNSFIQEEVQNGTVIEVAHDILSGIQEALSKSVTASIGKPVLSIDEICQSYDNACEKMLQKLLLGKGTVIMELSTPQSTNTELLQNSEYKKINRELMGCLQNLDRQKAVHLLDHFFIYIKESNVYNIQYIQNCCINIICQVQNYLFENNEAFEADLEYQLINWNNILKFETVEDICTYMKVIFENVIEGLEDKKNKRPSKVVALVIKYIEESFSKDITIKEIAKELYYSQNHLGVLFKKETGKGFSEYLTEYRMKKAQEFLKTTLLRTYQISNAVGYTNVNSFIKQFKLMYNMTPKEYRGRC